MSIHYRLKIATNIFSARTLNPNPRGQGNLKTSVTKAAFYRLLAARLEELRKKHLFCALRFATRKPAAARKYEFASTYGTTESRALIQVFTHESFSASSGSRALPKTSYETASRETIQTSL